MKASELVAALKPLEGHQVNCWSRWVDVVTVEELAPQYRDIAENNVIMLDGKLRDNGDGTTTPMGMTMPAARIERVEIDGEYVDLYTKAGKIVPLLIGHRLEADGES